MDDVLVDELGWLADLEFRHPAFPGVNIYAFTHPLLPRIVLDQLSEIERETKAVTLLRFLEQGVRVTKRGMARMFLAIAEHLGERERGPYARWLEWWSGLETTEALKEEVRAAIEADEVDAELVWRVVNDSKDWLAFRRLTLLDAYGEAVVGEGDEAMAAVPFKHLTDFHVLRSNLLRRVGRYAEALEDALRVLPLVEERSVMRAFVLNECGLARRELGRPQEAQADLEEAAELLSEILGSEHPSTLEVQNSLAIALKDQGERLLGGPLAAFRNRQAHKLLKQVLDAERRVLGSEHRNTLTTMDCLAMTLKAQREYSQARELEEQVLEALSRTLGLEHPDTLNAQHNLAGTLSLQGEYSQARELEEQALEAKRRILGPEHPSTLATLHSLTLTLKHQGEYSQARELEEQVLEARRRILGPEHPDTLTTTVLLAGTLKELGELSTARKLVEEAHASLTQGLGPEHPWTVGTAYVLASILSDLQDAENGPDDSA